MPKIDILLFCHNFQRRLCWVLSSLLQQTNQSYTVNIASLPNNGNPTTEGIIRYYRNRGMIILHHIFTNKDIFAKSSIIKNYQIKDCSSEWILFHSADHVFPTTYIDQLCNNLNGCKVDTCLGSRGKYHTNEEETNKIINGDIYIEKVYQKANDIIKKGRDRRVGGHLIVNRNALIKKTGGIYNSPDHCRDRHLFKKGMKSRGDLWFKSKMGGIANIKLPPLIHLNHTRDKELGYHTEEQR